VTPEPPDAELVALARSVAKWPTAQRRVFTLRKVYRLRPGDIALRLGLTDADVERHLIAAALACSWTLQATLLATVPRVSGELPPAGPAEPDAHKVDS